MGSRSRARRREPSRAVAPGQSRNGSHCRRSRSWTVQNSVFWNNLSPDGGDRPEGELAAAIDEHFGTFEAFQKQLTTATSTVQGSGWGVLAWEPLGRRLVVEQVYDHHGNVGMNTTPLLVFDAWEHAYYLQYRNVRPDYVEKLWTLVDWTDVTTRFDAARAS
ncbi:superoxide dismutase [Actinomadura meyerae]|uniref:superoxide dismutase n=1 Tax=Actinomadura meyerae TaxID=240840 RepID=UPI001FEA8E81|nr:superoxide dismutase [Actinomadura meyerae]